MQKTMDALVFLLYSAGFLATEFLLFCALQYLDFFAFANLLASSLLYVIYFGPYRQYLHTVFPNSRRARVITMLVFFAALAALVCCTRDLPRSAQIWVWRWEI